MDKKKWVIMILLVVFVLLIAFSVSNLDNNSEGVENKSIVPEIQGSGSAVGITLVIERPSQT